MRLRSVLKQMTARVLPQPLGVIRGPSHARRIALTFDDGPDEMTGDYLRLFDRLGLRATFFLVGERAAKRRRDVLDVVSAGHEVLGHGYTHTKFTDLDGPAMRREIDMTASVLPLARRRALRPPGGIFSATTLTRTALLGFSTILWSHDSLDAKVRDPEEICAQMAPSRLQNGDIVLMHEGQSWTLAALPRIVEALRADGFDLVTLGEMLGW